MESKTPKKITRANLEWIVRSKHVDGLLSAVHRDPEPWSVYQDSWRDKVDPGVEEIFDKTFESVLDVLKSKPRMQNDPAISRYAARVASYATEEYVLEKHGAPDFSSWSGGWEMRYKSALKSVIDLSRVLQRMDENELTHWLPFLNANMSADYNGHKSIEQAQLDDWVSMTHVISAYLTDAIERSQQKKSRAEEVSLYIRRLAADWVTCFKKLPAGSVDSAFTIIVRDFMSLLRPEVEAPSHPNIQKALKSIKPRLEYQLQQIK